MTVRKAEIEDYPAWCDLVRRLFDKTPYAAIPVDLPAISKLYSQCLHSKLGCVYVAEHGRLTGTIMGVAQTLWFSQKRYATDLLFYSERPGDGRLLLRAFLDWAWSLPSVVEVTLGQSSGIDVERTGILYERAGLTRVGSLYTKVKEL